MTRSHDQRGWRRLPATDRGYPGLTEYLTPHGKTIQCLGVGPEVDAAILKRVEGV